MRTLTRRGMGIGLAGLGTALLQAQTNKAGGTIHHEVDYKTTVDRIYQVLLDPRQFSSFSGAPAEIQPVAGGTFRLFAGQIEGRNVELIPNQRIVQAWRPASWPAGLYSIARFELVMRGSGARIVFDHTGFPADKLDELAQGWKDHYWEPLHAYLRA